MELWEDAPGLFYTLQQTCLLKNLSESILSVFSAPIEISAPNLKIRQTLTWICCSKFWTAKIRGQGYVIIYERQLCLYHLYLLRLIVDFWLMRWGEQTLLLDKRKNSQVCSCFCIKSVGLPAFCFWEILPATLRQSVLFKTDTMPKN